MKAEQIIEISKIVIALLPLAEAIVKMVQRLFAYDAAGDVKRDAAVSILTKHTGATASDATAAIQIAFDTLSASEFVDEYGTKFTRGGST